MKGLLPRIALTGFMGAGKTSVAEALARALGCEAVDLDRHIVARDGRAIHEIISSEGEARFRAIESRALEELLAQEKAQIIALGGGAWTLERNRAMLAEKGYIAVWLDAPFELCWERILKTDVVRPLACDFESARRLYEQRREIYALATLRVEVEGKSCEALADEIIRAVRT